MSYTVPFAVPVLVHYWQFEVDTSILEVVETMTIVSVRLVLVAAREHCSMGSEREVGVAD